MPAARGEAHPLRDPLARGRAAAALLPGPRGPRGRAVPASPPNAGSEIADELKHHWWFRRALGPAGQALGAREPLVFARPLPLEVGVIAGTRNYEPWFAGCFEGRPNDGKVSVESTRLPEMADFLTVHAGHTFMVRSGAVQSQVAAFLEAGRFER